MNTDYNNEPEQIERMCDICGTLYSHESILLGGQELGHTVNPYCDSCTETQSNLERERAALARQHQREAKIHQILPLDLLHTDKANPMFNRALWSLVSKWRPTRSRMWLFLSGAAGLCKTRCMALLFREFVMEGVKCTWTTAGEIQQAARDRGRYGKAYESATAKDAIRSWKSAECLFIDDLGKNDWPTDFEVLFFQILDHRKGQWLPIVFSSNLPPSALGAYISDLNRDPIVGRLLDRTTIYQVTQ